MGKFLVMSWSPSLPCFPWGRNVLIPVSGGVGFGLTTCGDNAAVGMRGKQQLVLSQKSGFRIHFITPKVAAGSTQVACKDWVFTAI